MLAERHLGEVQADIEQQHQDEKKCFGHHQQLYAAGEKVVAS